jgi:hypothetical protein
VIAARIDALAAEVAALRAVIERRVPAPTPVDDDAPVGVVSAAGLSGKSAKVLRGLIDDGAPFE